MEAQVVFEHRYQGFVDYRVTLAGGHSILVRHYDNDHIEVDAYGRDKDGHIYAAPMLEQYDAKKAVGCHLIHEYFKSGKAGAYVYNDDNGRTLIRTATSTDSLCDFVAKDADGKCTTMEHWPAIKWLLE